CTVDGQRGGVKEELAPRTRPAIQDLDPRPSRNVLLHPGEKAARATPPIRLEPQPQPFVVGRHERRRGSREHRAAQYASRPDSWPHNAVFHTLTRPWHAPEGACSPRRGLLTRSERGA